MAKKKSFTVQDTIISWQVVNDEDYICLTDMVRHYEEPDQVMRNWLRRIDTIEYLAAWETLYNPDQFKPVEFDRLRAQAGTARFTLSVAKWCATTGAIGITSKRGRGGGTYAHRDIAFHFGETISPTFHLLLIREFQRLKVQEVSREQLEWNANLCPPNRSHQTYTLAPIYRAARKGLTDVCWGSRCPQYGIVWDDREKLARASSSRGQKGREYPRSCK